ncbi:MAG: RMD1 family protein [Pseudomonadota bacterium]
MTSTADTPILTARALLLGERINTQGLERSDAYSAQPLAFQYGDNGFVAIFRYGVIATVGLSPIEEDDIIRGLGPRVHLPVTVREEETLDIRIEPGAEEQMGAGGRSVTIKKMTPDNLLVICDVLAKSVALAGHERQVSAVFDAMEPFARRLAEKGTTNASRRAMRQLIGQALMVQHVVADRVAIHDQPDVLWERPDLSRLYSRLQDEFEIVERGETLNRKLGLINDTASVLADLLDTEKSHMLELIIILLITFDILYSLVPPAFQWLKHILTT